MNFEGHDLPAAARRNLDAADALYEVSVARHRFVAGYLYGIAAECAVKAMALEAVIRDEDVLFAHFPELRTRLRDKVQGRRGQTLARFINDDNFLNNWRVKMRYSPSSQLKPEWVVKWQEQARAAVNAMGT